VRNKGEQNKSRFMGRDYWFLPKGVNGISKFFVRHRPPAK
jgi:hypothetical protein